MEKPIAYIHIPKTAGTSFERYLQYRYGDRYLRLSNQGGWKRLITQPETTEELKNRIKSGEIQIIGGHMPYGIHIWLDMEFDYITFLRNPIERLISLYYYIRSRKRHVCHAIAKHLDLYEFIRDKIFADTDNGMVRFVSGRHECGINDPGRDVDLVQTCLAAIRLSRFKFFGLQSRISESIGLFETLYGKSLNATFPKAMVNVKKPPVHYTTIHMLGQHVEFDQALYETAVKMFEMRQEGLQV